MTWTEAQFFAFIRSALRSACVRWPPRSETLKAARRRYNGPNKRQKWEYQCAICMGWHKGTNVQVDHITPCGELQSFYDLGGFAARLFCEVDGLRVLCKPCHKARE